MADFSHITLDTSQSNPKFLTPEHLAVFDKLCCFLLELCQLEDEFFQNSKLLEGYKQENGLSSHQSIPGEEALWQEFAQKKKTILQRGFVTPAYLERGWDLFFGCPPDHDYVRSSGTAWFIMKSKDKLVVEYEDNQKIRQFTLRRRGDDWLLAGQKYRFLRETTWTSRRL